MTAVDPAVPVLDVLRDVVSELGWALGPGVVVEICVWMLVDPAAAARVVAVGHHEYPDHDEAGKIQNPPANVRAKGMVSA